MHRNIRHRRVRLRRTLASWSAALTAVAGLVLAAPGAAHAAASATTAWHHGTFHLDPAGVVSRSDLVLGSPNVSPSASVPLGNGSLGVAAWAAGGFTAQLNRSDTMPDRKSPGQLTIPGLSVISHAADFSGRLDLTDGVLRESGGGMTMKAWVDSGKDELIVDVTGADPAVPQTASISLWSGRTPTAAAHGTLGTLAETWTDTGPQIPSGRTFGSLAAITAGGRDVAATVTGPTQVQVAFTPHPDGTFRVVAAAPGWTGGDAQATASRLVGPDATVAERALMSTQDRWWTRFWTHSGLVEANSADGSAAYVENLRTLYLYEEAASMKQGIYPGSQAGEADMFAWSRDQQTWQPSAYWLWNLRTQIAANMSSGNYALNTPIFDMYAEDLPQIEAWTRQQMGGRPGICLPETMRFNGNGGDTGPGANASCSEPGSPNWNALDISSGPEVALYMWQQYQATGDRAALARYFPFMRAAAVFQLAYQTTGSDGLLHAVANAHETQWAVQDPTTDIAVDHALFPVIEQAAHVLGTEHTTDKELVARVREAATEIPPYPRTDQATRSRLLNPHYTRAETDAADATGSDILAISYEPAAERRNGENIELEPLWPWNTVSDQDPGLFALEQRSYAHRPNTGGNDWSMDAIDAARLQDPAEVRAKLLSITESHQVYANGFADLGSTAGYQPYIEQESGVATAVDEALAQDFDGIVRFAPAWPAYWDVSGSVYLRHGTRADVQVQGGALVTAAIEAGATETLTVKNPWPGGRTEVVDGATGHTVTRPTGAALLHVPVSAGRSYLVQRADAPTAGLPFAAVTGTPASAAKHLGHVQLGLDAGTTTGTATVGTVLAGTDRSYGLTRLDDPSTPGATSTPGDVGGRTARTTGSGPAGSDLSFGVDDETAATGSYDGTLHVAYYDSGTDPIALEVDAGPHDPHHPAGTIARTGSGTWKSADVPFTGAWFGGDQAQGADLRLHSATPFSVHSAALTVSGAWVPGGRAFPPAPVITAPRQGGTAKLAAPVTGTTVPDATVTVDEGSAPVCTATADDSGAWSCSPDGGFPSGRHTITATTTDPSGPEGDASAGIAFTASDLPPGTAVVGAVVGPDNHAYGMSEDERPSGGFDGPTTASVIDGLTARTSTQSNIYFDIDDSIAHAGFYTAAFTISYYDQGTGSFAVHYDNGSSDPYKSTSSIPLTGTNTWKTATVTAPDAYFGGLQHSGADFRLRNGGGQVTVHSVTVRVTGDGVANTTPFAPPVTITTPGDGATVGATPTVTGMAEPDAKVTVTADGASVCTAVAADDGGYTCTAGTALTAGPHTLTAAATDVTGSAAPQAGVRVVVP